jgi:hypothetical protein
MLPGADRGESEGGRDSWTKSGEGDQEVQGARPLRDHKVTLVGY